ncbi:MAG: AI-2E family transporter [Muribaculaceae bacterium]|nr:AI-2E family transporter [Muribaculaceae bacterium]
MTKSTSPHFWNIDRIMHLILGTTLVCALLWLINYLSDVLLPFFVACFIAYVLQPVVEFNRRITKAKHRLTPSLLTILEVAIVITILIYIFLPSVVKELDELGDILKRVAAGEVSVPIYCAAILDFIDRFFDPQTLVTMLNGQHIETLLSKGSTILEGSIEVLLHTLEWLLTLVYILFILIDYPQIVRGFKLIIPHKYRPQSLEIIREVQVSMNHYFRGQGVVALCATVFYCVGFSIVGLPLAIPMGLLVGILYMIPYFQYVTLIPVAAICFIYSLGGGFDFLTELGKCLIVYAVSQSICDYIITPHVMGKELGMNPAIILLSLSIWGSLLGIIGMIIALPITALIMTYYERYISYPRPPKEDPPEDPPVRETTED